jgi:hypothetical protein
MAQWYEITCSDDGKCSVSVDSRSLATLPPIARFFGFSNCYLFISVFFFSLFFFTWGDLRDYYFLAPLR